MVLRALASLHDDNGDVAVAGLDREEWTGESYTDDEFRELAEVLPGLPLQGTGGLGSRVWSGPAITVTGIDVPSVANALNAVSPYARAKINLRVHPAQDAKEAQARARAAPARPCGRSGSRSRSTPRRPATASRPTPPARPTRRRARRTRPAWGTPAVNAAGGGSIPLVSALQAAAPKAEVLLVGATDGYSNIHAPDERVLLDELEKATARRGRVLRRVREALELSPMADTIVPDPRSRPVEKTGMERVLDGIERLGNKMPDPAILFLWLCLGVILLSQALAWLDVKATYEVVAPPPVPAEETYYGGSSRPGLRRARTSRSPPRRTRCGPRRPRSRAC